MRRTSRDTELQSEYFSANDTSSVWSEQNRSQEEVMNSTSSTNQPFTSVNEQLKWVIFPSDRWIRYWDGMMISLLFILLFIIPYQLGVSASYYLIQNIGWMIVNLIIDMIFLVDTFLYFFRAYRDEGGRIVFNRRKIRRRYLTTFFIWNILGNFPATLILYFGWKDSDGGEFKSADTTVVVLKGIDLLKLCRFVRIPHLSSSSEAINEFKQNRKSQAKLELLKYCFLVCTTSHCFACFWSFLAFAQAGTFSDGLLEKDNWIAFWYDQNYQEGTINPIGWTQDTDRYILSLFWSIQSITSIGYGNILPFTPLEWWFSSVLMLLAGVLWAYIIGGLVGIAAALEGNREMHRMRTDQANEMINYFSKTEPTKEDMCDSFDTDRTAFEKRIKHFIQHQKMYSDTLTSASSLEEAFPVIETLSPELQRLSCFMILRDYLELVPYLSSRFLSVEERSIVAKECLRLEFAAGESIQIDKGINNIGRGIFILVNGSAFAAHGRYKTFSEKRKQSFVLTAGDSFGHFHVLLEDGATGSVGEMQFIVFTRVIFIPRSAVIEALQKNSKAWKDCARWKYFLVSLLNVRIEKSEHKLIQNVEVTGEEENGCDDNVSDLSSVNVDEDKKLV